MNKTQYITRAGWIKLDNELKFLWKQERPKATQAVSEAAALGDRSENAEYIYGKKRLREIDRRIRFLSKRLEILKIVDYHPQQQGKVFFGAWVSLLHENQTTTHHRIVGTDEIQSNDCISIDSPVARALIGKQVDDEVSLITPSGRKTFYIEKIWYEEAK